MRSRPIELAIAALLACIPACATETARGSSQNEDELSNSSDDDGAKDASPAHGEPDASLSTVALASESCTGNIPFVTPSFEVLEDEASFQEAYQNATNDAEPPTVDFDTHVVLAAFAGLQNNCGTQVRIAEVAEREDVMEVQVALSRPGNCFVEQALSYPYAFALAERTSLPFEFVETETTRVCEDP